MSETKQCRDCGQVFPIETFPTGGHVRGKPDYRARCVECHRRMNRVYRRDAYHARARALAELRQRAALAAPVRPEREPRPIEPRVDQYRIACVVCGYEVFDALTEARMRRLSTACVRCGRCRGPVEFEVVTDWGVRTSMLAAHSTTHQPGLAHAWRESMA